MRRIPELDGLRDLAALAVLRAHLGEGRWPVVGWRRWRSPRGT